MTKPILSILFLVLFGYHISANTLSLSTQDMYLDFNDRRLLAYKDVVLSTEGQEIKSPQSIVELDKERLVFLDGVTANIHSVRAYTDHFVFDWMAQKAEGNSKVDVYFKDYELQAGAIQFNMEDNHILLTDKIQVNSPKQSASADTAKIDLDRNQLDLKGNIQINAK